MSQPRGTLARLAEARGRGGLDYLTFLEETDAALVRNMEVEAGSGQCNWARNWATRRLRHVRQQPGQPQEPLDNDLFSIIESGRTPFNDNAPIIEWEARRGAAAARLWIYRRIWEWIALEAGWRDWWLSMYDLLDECGYSAAEIGWDHGPRLWRADQRRTAFDARCLVDHRTAAIARTATRVELGELQDLYPEFAARIAPAAETEAARSRELERGRDYGDRAARWRQLDDEAEVRRTWFRLRPPVAVDAAAEPRAAAPWLVAAWIPGAGVIDDQVVDGGRVFSAQKFRNPEHVVGIASVDMVIGMIQAAHRYQMRCHRFRLTSAIPEFLLPRDTGLEKKDLGGEARILQPATADSARGIGHVATASPSADLLAFLDSVMPRARRTLGMDELTSEVLQRQLTATQVQAVREAVESRTRQAISNFSPMACDAAAGLMRLFLERRGEPIEVPRLDDDGADILTPEMWAELDPDEVAPRSSTDRTGPLTAAGKLEAIELIKASGIFNDETGAPDLPDEVAEEYIDLVAPPRASVLKAALRRRRAAEQVTAQEAEAAAAAAAAAPGPAPEQKSMAAAPAGPPPLEPLPPAPGPFPEDTGVIDAAALAAGGM